VGFLAAHGLRLQDKELSTHGRTSTTKIKIIALTGLIVCNFCHWFTYQFRAFLNEASPVVKKKILSS
jgi:hypothetical protein